MRGTRKQIALDLSALKKVFAQLLTVSFFDIDSYDRRMSDPPNAPPMVPGPSYASGSAGVPGMPAMPVMMPGVAPLSPREFQERYDAQLRQHQAQIAAYSSMNQAAVAVNPMYAAQNTQLRMFWRQQMQEIQQTTDFKNHLLPLARIKKIMKSDEDVRMISSEAPVLFAKACEMFILELTMRAWVHSQEGKRRTLHRNDIAAAITKTDIFDFLVDIVPREEDQPTEGGGLDDGDATATTTAAANSLDDGIALPGVGSLPASAAHIGGLPTSAVARPTPAPPAAPPH